MMVISSWLNTGSSQEHVVTAAPTLEPYTQLLFSKPVVDIRCFLPEICPLRLSYKI